MSPFSMFSADSVHVIAFLYAVPFLYIAFQVVKYMRNFYHDRRLCYIDGCLPPPSYPHSDVVLGLGHLRSLIKARKEKRLPTAFSAIFTDTGPNVHTVAHYILGKKSYWTMDPENIKAVLATNFKDWELPPARKSAFSRCYGGGIFGVDGPDWEHSRAMLRPSFNRSQVGDVNMLEKHVENLIARIPNGQTVDLAELFPLLTMDIGTEMLFGESAGCLNLSRTHEAMEFASSFDYVAQKMSIQMGLPLLAKIPDAKLKQCVKYVNDFASSYVNRAISIRDNRSVPVEGQATQSEDEKKLKKRYIFLVELAKSNYPADKIKVELLSIMVAGRDTTAALLSVTWWHLARRPDIVEKLQNEVKHLGDKPPTTDELKSLKYLKWVMNEGSTSPSIPNLDRTREVANFH
jgi:cytochrome P450